MYTDFRGRALKIQDCWVKTELSVILYVLLVVRLPEFYKAEQMQEEQLSSYSFCNFLYQSYWVQVTQIKKTHLTSSSEKLSVRVD